MKVCGTAVVRGLCVKVCGRADGHEGLTCVKVSGRADDHEGLTVCEGVWDSCHEGLTVCEGVWNR